MLVTNLHCSRTVPRHSQATAVHQAKVILGERIAYNVWRRGRERERERGGGGEGDGEEEGMKWRHHGQVRM